MPAAVGTPASKAAPEAGFTISQFMSTFAYGEPDTEVEMFTVVAKPGATVGPHWLEIAPMLTDGIFGVTKLAQWSAGNG